MKDYCHPKRITEDGIVESPRSLPIRCEYDVVVCGGGAAGVGAALAAAREGAKTLLIEKHGILGGVWTAGLLNPFFECVGRGWLVDELVQNLTAAGAFSGWREHDFTFDVEVMRRTLEQMMADAGVELLYYTLVADAIVEDDRLRGVVIESKAGREAVLGTVLVDATGDGDLLARAGCEYDLGRARDGMLQPMTLMFEIDGLPEGWEQAGSEELFDQMVEVIRQKELGIKLPYPRCGYAPWVINTPVPGVADVQCTHAIGIDPLDPASLTQGTIDCRRQAAETVEVFRHIPEFKNVRLTHSAAQIGVREARRLKGRYSMTIEDLIEGRCFDDAVTSCAFVIDVHDPEKGGTDEDLGRVRIKPYEIPYRAMLPESMRGLLVAGRCISGNHEAHASYRVTGTAMALGQAAGLAAAWAVRDGRELDEVDGGALHGTLQERGAKFAVDVRVVHQ
ncbi:hypothetical protein PDESU_01064 [Pontiella desulfatans]|uniref:Thiazole biosynthetic enzyme n=1 Tax=Pontiella desulfatans TaxID=2750659 RepID=A0A6C2TYT2_PONDE|nr:FAD-dependent oxidoreductase [Pontiella desulfatans]VGO12511.1 hypothetical protein PDESU_01064 [Pontiella desulfatans]